MATKTWTGNAAAVKQIDQIAVSGAWAATNTCTLTINGKDLVVTIGADVTTAQVATAIRDAWNANSRLDSEGMTDATSNFGGQEFGEFAEATASIDPDATSTVLITANMPGKPFTLTVAETAAGDATESTTQAATGPNHWDNPDNWDTVTVPANDDTVVFRDSDVSCLYGLPNGSLEVTMQQYQSYTGKIGLAGINRDNQSKPYTEYRQRYVRLDDAGTGADIAHRFGIGVTGNGSPLINLKHSTLKCSPVVYNTGTPQIQGTKALNICCTANTSTLNIVGGFVDFSSQDGSTSAFLTYKQTGGQVRAISGIHTTGATVQINGGELLLGGAGAIDTVILYSGTLRFENQTGTITSLDIVGGTVDYASTGTITSLFVTGGTFDARVDAGGFTATNTDVAKGKFIDPYRRGTYTNPITVSFEPSDNLQFGANSNNTIAIAP